MANARAVIDIDINTSPAAAALRSLQSQINGFSSALNKANTEQGLAAKGMARQLSDLVNSSKFFTAETVRMQTSAAQLDSTLKKGQVSMGQFFSAKFRKDGLAAAQVMSLANARASALQTQFIQVGAAAGGMREALAIRPLQAFNSAATVSAQKLAIQRAMLQQATTSMINFGKNTQWAGRQLMVGFTVPLTIFGGLASKTFRELEAEAINFKKVYGDIFTTEEETEEALQAVKDLSLEFTKYGIAVKDSMALAGVAAQSGLRNAELMAATTEATRLATLGQMEQAEAMKTIISLQTAFKSSNDELAESVDFLNIIENQTVLALQDVAGAIPRVAPVIQGLGGDVKDLAVLLVAMKEGGVSAGEGANALKTSLSRLISPTKAAKDMASEFGINLNSIVENNRGQVVPMIKELADAMQSLDGLSQQRLLSEVFGKRQFARMGALFSSITDSSSQAARAMELINMSAQDLAATADKELATMEEATGTKMVAAMERLKVAIAPIGEMFLKMATPIINFLASIAEKFNNLPDFAKRFVGLATVITGLVIPAGTMFLGLLMNLVGTLAKFGHLVGIAFKGFMSGGFKGAFDNVSQALKYMSLQEIDAANAAQQLAGTTQAVNAALLDQVSRAEASTTAVMGLAGAYDLLVQNMRESMLVGGLPMAVPGQAGLRAGRSGLLYKPLPIVARNKGGSIPYMSTGSTVPGTGNTDTVPAMLTPGEFVVNKQATQQNMGLLHAINNGDVQYRNKGGGIAKTGRGYYGVRPNPFALAAQQARARLEEFESSRSAIAQTFGLPVGGAPRSVSAFGATRRTQVSTARKSRDIFDAVVGTNTKAARMLRAAESLGISKDEMGLKQVGNFVLAMSKSSNVKMANGTLAKQRLLTELDSPGAFNPLSEQLRKYFGKSLDDRLFDEIYRQQISMLPESGISNALFEKASRNALRVYLDRSGFDKTSRKTFLRDVLSPDSVRGNLTRDRIRQALKSRGITPDENGGDIKAIVNGEEFNFGDLAGRTITRLGRPRGIIRYDDLDVPEGLERVHANKGGMIPGVQYARLGRVIQPIRRARDTTILSGYRNFSWKTRGPWVERTVDGYIMNLPAAERAKAAKIIQENAEGLTRSGGARTAKTLSMTNLVDDPLNNSLKKSGLPLLSDRVGQRIHATHLTRAYEKGGKRYVSRYTARYDEASNLQANMGTLQPKDFIKRNLLSPRSGGRYGKYDDIFDGVFGPGKPANRNQLEENIDRLIKQNINKEVKKNPNVRMSDEPGLDKITFEDIVKSTIDDVIISAGGSKTKIKQLSTRNVVRRNKGGIIPGFARGGALMSRAAQLKAIKEVHGFGILGGKIEDKSLRSIFRLGFNDTRTDSPSDFVRSMFGRWETTPTRISPKENTTMLLKGKKPKYAPVSQEDYLADMIMSGNRFSDVVDAFKPITIGRMRGTGETRVFDGHTRIHSQVVKGLIERKLGLSTAGMSKEELVEAIKIIRQMSLDGKITNTDVMRATSGQRVLTRGASDREVDKLFDHPLRRQPMGSMMNREGRTLIAGIHDAEIESIVNAARKANFYGVGKDPESLMKSMGFVSLGGGSRFRYEPGADFRNRSSYINNMGRRITDDLIDRGEILPLRRNKGGIIPGMQHLRLGGIANQLSSFEVKTLPNGMRILRNKMGEGSGIMFQMGKHIPFHKGHEDLLFQGLRRAQEKDLDYLFAVSGAYGRQKEQALSPELKRRMILEATGTNPNMVDPSGGLMSLLKGVKGAGYKDFVEVVGADRAGHYSKIADSFGLRSSSMSLERSGVSGTLLRELAVSGKFDDFVELMPASLSQKMIKEIYESIRSYSPFLKKGEKLPRVQFNKGGMIPTVQQLNRGGKAVELLRSYMAGNFDIMRDATTRKQVMSLATPQTGTFYRGTQIGSGALPKYLEKELLQAQKTGDYSKVLGKTFKMRSSDWSTDESTAARFMQMNRAKEKQDFLNYEKNLVTRQLKDAEEYISRVESGRIGFVNEGLLQSSRTKIPMLRKDLERINRELAEIGELSPLLIKASGTMKGVEASKLVPDATYLGRAINEDNIISSSGMFQIKSASNGRLEIIPAQQRNDGGEIFESAKKTVVPGVGNKDTVPAALTPGEFVINKQATQANKPLLQAINSGKAIAMNKGGLIPGMQYLNPGGMAQRMAQQSRAMSSKGIYTKSEVEDIFGNIRPTYRLKDQDYMFRGYGEKPGVIGKTSTVKELDATPESLLSEAIVLNPNDPKLKTMLSNFKNKNFGNSEVSLLDDIAAAMAINKQGEFSPQEKTSGLALVLAALSGDEKARTSVNIKKQSFYRKVEEAKKEEIQRNKAIQADSEAASLDELAFVHSTRHKIDRGPDGTITLKPAAHHRLGTEESYPRSSVHFTINSKVQDHVMGSWDAANKLIVTSGRKVIDANNNPAALRSVDTFWEIGPGENMILRNASVVNPHNNQSIYKRELVNRGIANSDGTLPFLVDDAARNDVLYFTKATDEYTNDDRIRILQDLGRTEDEARALATTIQGQENSLLEREALKRAMQQQKVAAEPETLGQWGYNYNTDLDARIGALAQKRGISGEIHAGTPAAQLEKSAVMPMGYDHNRFNGANINSYRWLIASGHTKTKSTRPKANLNFMDGNTGGMVPGVQYFARNMLQRVVQPLRGPAIISNERQKRNIERKLALWLGGGMKNVNIRELTSLGLARRQQETELFRGMPIRSLKDGATPRFAPEVHEALYRYARNKDPKELDGILGKPIAIGARSFSKSRKTAEEFAENISEKDASFVFKIRDEKGIYGIDPYQKLGRGRQSESYRDLRREYKRKEKEVIPVGSPEKGRPDVVVGRIALDKDGSVVIDTGAKLSRRETVAVTKEYDEMIGARYTPRSVIRTAEDEVQKLWAQYQRLKHRQSKGESISSKEAGDLYAAISRVGLNLPQDGTLNLRTNREIRTLVRMRESMSKMSDDLVSIFNRAKVAGLNNGGFISPTLQMNNGNIVPGVGNTDTVPAMLTPGEFVVNQRATQENLPLLHAINSGSAVGMNKGGKIPGVQYLVNGGPVGIDTGGLPIYETKDGRLVYGNNRPVPDSKMAEVAGRQGAFSRFGRMSLFNRRTPSPSGGMMGGMMGGGMRGMGASMGLGMGGMGMMMAGQQMQASAAQRGQESAMGSNLSNAGIAMQMASIIPFLGPAALPVAGIAAVAGGAGLGINAFNTAMDSATRSAAEFASNVGAVANPLKEMGSLLGVLTPAQRKSFVNLGVGEKETQEFQSKFGEVFSSEEGAMFIQELQSVTSSERFEKLADYLKYSIAAGVMDRESAKTFARVVSSELGDAFLGARAVSAIAKQTEGPRSLLNLAKEREAAIENLQAFENVQTSSRISERDTGTIIGSSNQVLQDFAEASGLAYEQMVSGEISIEEYQSIINESREAQAKYSSALIDSMKKTKDFGAAMQAVIKEFEKSKIATEEEIKESETSFRENVIEEGLKKEEQRAIEEGMSWTAVNIDTTRRQLEESFDRQNQELMGIVLSAASEGMPMETAIGIATEMLVGSQGFGTENPDPEDQGKGIGIAISKELQKNIRDYGAAAALEIEYVAQRIESGDLVQLETGSGSELTADAIERETEKVGNIFKEYIDSGGQAAPFLTWIESIPEEKRFKFMIDFGGLGPDEQQEYLADASAFAQAYGQEFQLRLQESDFYKGLLERGSTRELRGAMEYAAQTGLSERVINYSIKESNQETTPDQLANKIESLTDSFIRLGSLPEELRKTLRIDLDSGIDLERFGPFTEEIQSGWELIDNLDADVAKELVANAVLLDGEGNVRSFDDMAYEIGNLNIAYKSLQNLSPEIRKQAIIDIATNLGEGDPDAILGRILADIPDFYELGGGQQAFILEQYGQAFSRTQGARDALAENERQRQEILDQRQREPDHLGKDEYGQEDLDRLEEERKSLEKTTEGYMAYEQAKAAAIASGAGFTVGPELMGALGLSYTDEVFKQGAKQISDAWDIMQGLPQELDLSLVARFMVFGNNDEPLSAEEVAKQGKDLVKAFKNLESEDPEKRMAGQETIGLAYAMQVIGGPELVDENGESVSAEEVRNRAFEELQAQFPDFGELSIEVQGAMITSRIDYIVEGAALAARNAELEKNLQDALAAGDSEAARIISRQIDANNNKIGELRETAEAVSEVQYRKPSRRTGGGGGGGGQEEKSILEQLEEQFKNLKDIYKSMKRFIDYETGAFKSIAAGPFGPEFIEFLKSQGEEGLKIIKGKLSEIRKAYKEFRNIQRQEATNFLQILPANLIRQSENRVIESGFRDRLTKAGFEQEEADIFIEGMGGAEGIREYERLQKKVNRLKKEGKKLSEELSRSEINFYRETNRAIRQGAIPARELANQRIGDALKEQERDIAAVENILRAVPGASQETIDSLLSLGITSQSSAQRIQSAATALDSLTARAYAAQPALMKLNNTLNAQAGALQAQISFNEYTVIAPMEEALQGLQDQLRGLDRSVELKQRSIRSIQREIELEERLKKPIEDRIEELQEEQEVVDENYTNTIDSLEKVERLNERIARQRQGRMDVASALSRGDVAAAAQAALDMQRSMAEMRQEDTREGIDASFDEQRKNIEEAIRAEREKIEEIDERIEQKQLSIRAIQDEIFEIENQRLALQDQIYQKQLEIEAARKRQLEIEKQIARIQMVQSMIETQQQIRLAAQQGDTATLGFLTQTLDFQNQAMEFDPEFANIPGVQPVLELTGDILAAAQGSAEQIKAAFEKAGFALTGQGGEGGEGEESGGIEKAAQDMVDTATGAASILKGEPTGEEGEGEGKGKKGKGKGKKDGGGLEQGAQDMVDTMDEGVTELQRLTGGGEKSDGEGILPTGVAVIDEQMDLIETEFKKLPDIASNIVGHMDAAEKALKDIATAIGNIQIPKIGQGKGGMYGGVVRRAFGGMINYKGSREPAPGMMMGGKVKKFAFGSFVPGTGMTDTVPALLTPGEFVVRKSVAQQMMPALKAMNSQVFPGMGIPQKSSLKMPPPKSTSFSMSKPTTMSSPQFDTMRNINPSSFTFGMPQNITNYSYPQTNLMISQSNMDNSPVTNIAGPSNVQYTYNLSVNANTNASPDEIANTVMYKIKRFDDRRIRGTQVG